MVRIVYHKEESGAWESGREGAGRNQDMGKTQARADAGESTGRAGLGAAVGESRSGKRVLSQSASLLAGADYRSAFLVLFGQFLPAGLFQEPWHGFKHH